MHRMLVNDTKCVKTCIFIGSSWCTQPSYSLAWFHFHLRWWSGFVCNNCRGHIHCRYQLQSFRRVPILLDSYPHGTNSLQMSGCSLSPEKSIKQIQGELNRSIGAPQQPTSSWRFCAENWVPEFRNPVVFINYWLGIFFFDSLPHPLPNQGHFRC